MSNIGKIWVEGLLRAIPQNLEKTQRTVCSLHREPFYRVLGFNKPVKFRHAVPKYPSKKDLLDGKSGGGAVQGAFRYGLHESYDELVLRTGFASETHRICNADVQYVCKCCLSRSKPGKSKVQYTVDHGVEVVSDSYDKAYDYSINADTKSAELRRSPFRHPSNGPST